MAGAVQGDGGSPVGVGKWRAVQLHPAESDMAGAVQGDGGSPVGVGKWRAVQLHPAESNTAGAVQGDGGSVGGQHTQVQADLQDKLQHHILNF